jgi:hypothetical protein
VHLHCLPAHVSPLVCRLLFLWRDLPGDSVMHAPAKEEPKTASHGSFLSYYEVLRDNRAYRLLWLAETIDNVGGWLSYVATLGLVENFSQGSGLALSAVVLIR